MEEITVLKDGKQTIIQPVIYKNLPGKGFGRSFDGIDMYTPVIISATDAMDRLIFGYSEAEMERRAFELNADMNSMVIPSESCSEPNRIKFWFSPKSNNLNP